MLRSLTDGGKVSRRARVVQQLLQTSSLGSLRWPAHGGLSLADHPGPLRTCDLLESCTLDVVKHGAPNALLFLGTVLGAHTGTLPNPYGKTRMPEACMRPLDPMDRLLPFRFLAKYLPHVDRTWHAFSLRRAANLTHIGFNSAQ